MQRADGEMSAVEPEMKVQQGMPTVKEAQARGVDVTQENVGHMPAAAVEAEFECLDGLRKKRAQPACMREVVLTGPTQCRPLAQPRRNLGFGYLWLLWNSGSHRRPSGLGCSERRGHKTSGIWSKETESSWDNCSLRGLSDIFHWNVRPSAIYFSHQTEHTW